MAEIKIAKILQHNKQKFGRAAVLFITKGNQEITGKALLKAGYLPAYTGTPNIKSIEIKL